MWNSIIIRLLSFFLFFFPLVAEAINLSFSGTAYEPIKIVPSASSGIAEIYVLYDLKGISISYSTTSDDVQWSIYGNMGGAYAEPLSGIMHEGDSYILENPRGNVGYIIHDNGRDHIFWITDYSEYKLNLGKISVNDNSDCEISLLDFQGEASPIYYYSINGKQEILSRQLELEYINQIWDSENYDFNKEKITSQIESITTQITIVPPLYCGSTIELKGDRFLKEWGLQQTVSTNFYDPVAVDVRTTVESENDSANSSDNQIGSAPDGLGGSAPYSATFYSYVTEGVLHYEWQMSDDPQFNNITYRFNDEDLTYTFTEKGVTYIRFVGSNADGSCEAFSDLYTVNIGSSELLIPNVFSPNGDGINDVWKVSYRSLLNFKCQIYDKHGHQIYHFENPDGGWDGKNGSKFVNPGVYFYVIEATGADGKKYKKSGDINIINSYSTGSGSSID